MVEFSAPWPLPHEQVLLQELNHRINNEFTTAISVVSLAAASSRNDKVKTALTAVADMLHHYAHVHRALQMPEHDDTVLDAEAYLSRLCLSISRSYLDNRNIKLSLAIEPLLLPADRSWRLGMIVYELILNAARHAFEDRGGEIRVAVSRDAALVKCIVQDNGSAANNIVPGRGLKIVMALSNALDGRFKQTFGPHGSTSVLVFPRGGDLNNCDGTLPKRQRSRSRLDTDRQRTTARDVLST
jgi:two-component sensor histidine kinase